MGFENTGNFKESEMSPGLLQDFMVFVLGVARGNKDAGSVQDFILLYIRRIRRQGESEIPLCTLVVESFSSDFL